MFNTLIKKWFCVGLCLSGTMLLNAEGTIPNHLPDWAFGGFVRPEGVNPVISPKESTTFNCPASGKVVQWESNDTFNPAATVKNRKIVVLYRAEDKLAKGLGKRTSRLGYAESRDGIRFTRKDKPVFFPDKDSQYDLEWPGGSEDPRVAVTEDSTYVMFYTQWNQKNARLGVATSRDLIKWNKHGPIFQKAHNGKFHNMWSKSASIVTTVKDGKQVIAKINGEYFMYWGEDAVYAATSPDLVNWIPVVDTWGNLVPLIKPRKGFFDSTLTECGPPAVLTERGIVLIYNGKNASGKDGDERFARNAYCAGQVLFDAKNPLSPIARLDSPFLRPMDAFEKSGQYVDGTVFVEGLAYHNKKWFLYYGCADSLVGVAVYDPAKPALGDPLPVRK